MNDKRHSRGNKNPHMKTTEKKPCILCGQSVDHYADGTVSAHRVYEYEKVKGVMRKTNRWHYCHNKRWY